MHELSEQYIELLHHSVAQMRRIRTRGLSTMLTNNDPEKINGVFEDAQTLGTLTAETCVDYVLDGDSNNLAQWQKLIAHYQERDKAVPQTSKMFINAYESDFNKYAAFATQYQQTHLIDFLLRKNRYGSFNEVYMFRPEMLGVFSPLSFDYTCALYISQLYGRTHGICNFEVMPVLMDTKGQMVRLPTQTNDESVFADKNAITFFIDAHESGDTKNALVPALVSHFPRHEVIS